MISLDDALRQVLAEAPPLSPETKPIAAAHGRILAEPVVARITQPPFDASAMDGYAVRAEDISPGRPLALVGTSQAGARFAGEVHPGECVRIFTGAPVPAGANAVIMQEKAVARDMQVSFEDMPGKGQNIRPAGQDFGSGDIVLDRGTELKPAALALAAAANVSEVSVFRRPKVALLATGDELVPPGAKPSADQIIASNSCGLHGLFASHCEDVQDLGIAPDHETVLRATLERGLDSGADVLVTTGGASVGDRDIVQPLLKSLGLKMGFWKIAMRPGKPLMFGKRGSTLVFGLPGNPVSALVTATVVLLPALRALAGVPEPITRTFAVPLSAPLPPNGPRRHFVRARFERAADGQRLVRPMAATDSAHLSSYAQAEALIVHPENAPARARGDLVEVLPL